MYSKSIQHAKGSLFPIIATIYKNGNVAGRQVAGTGFFINEEGLFATALHVVNGDPSIFQYGSLGNVPYARFNNATPEPIIEVGRNPDLDLYLSLIHI